MSVLGAQLTGDGGKGQGHLGGQEEALGNGHMGLDLGTEGKTGVKDACWGFPD